MKKFFTAIADLFRVLWSRIVDIGQKISKSWLRAQRRLFCLDFPIAIALIAMTFIPGFFVLAETLILAVICLYFTSLVQNDGALIRNFLYIATGVIGATTGYFLFWYAREVAFLALIAMMPPLIDDAIETFQNARSKFQTVLMTTDEVGV